MSPLNRRYLIQTGLVAWLLGILAVATNRHRPPKTTATSASPPASPQAGPNAASPTPAAVVKMTMQLRFEPTALTINVGQVLEWTNISPLPHTTTDDPSKNPVASVHPEYARLPGGAAPWDSGLLNQGQSFSHLFTVPGTYDYFCIPHVLSGMRGTITVKR